MPYSRHRKNDLLNKIINALNDDGWNVLFLHDPRDHPFDLRIFNENETHDIKIYVWNLTHGGGAARAADEYRIQITGVNQFESFQNGKVLILGWWDEGQVFAGFDFNFHREVLGHSPSIQIKEEALRNGYVNGFGIWQKGNNEIAIAIRPDFLGEYIKRLEELHSFGESPQDLALLDNVIENPTINNVQIEQVTIERRETVQIIRKKIRDNSFKNRVLTAYSGSCAFCGVQLKLVDAAHIIPVENNGTDETSNGIALCALHHRAYDRRLIAFDETYRIMVNVNQMNNLTSLSLDGGRENFENSLRPIIILPPAINDRPHIDFIREANKIRGWTLSL
ncbi:HNH endonuclease [Fluviicola sp.]|uniref:HNH endonuclease n=1 Tax=Fluviicola sp. TaxID=1917219 RepID=UPI0031E3E2A3